LKADQFRAASRKLQDESKRNLHGKDKRGHRQRGNAREIRRLPAKGGKGQTLYHCALTEAPNWAGVKKGLNHERNRKRETTGERLQKDQLIFSGRNFRVKGKGEKSVEGLGKRGGRTEKMGQTRPHAQLPDRHLTQME